MSNQLATGAGVTVGATLLMGGAAQAATLTVGSLADTSGATDCAVATNTDCSLRDAIDDANSDPGSTITFRSGLSGTITLGSSLPALLQAATISGPGAGQATVDANERAGRGLILRPARKAAALPAGARDKRRDDRVRRVLFRMPEHAQREVPVS